jgi:CRP-like cAMP-binding protein
MKIYEKYSGEYAKAALFYGIDPQDIVSMLSCLQPKISCYRKNDIIINAGEKLESIGMVLSGEVAVIKENAAGNRVMMMLIGPGDLFGETVAFAGSPRWPATVQAQAASDIMFIPLGKIVGECEKMCSWHRGLISNMLRIIAERALMLNKKVEYLAIRSMRGKLSAYLLEEYKKAGTTTFSLPLKRNELADFLNVSRPSMSREMSRMRDEGVIDFHLSAITIKNMNGLKRMLE